MRTMIRYALVVAAALAFAPARAAMTKDEPTPPVPSEARQQQQDEPAARDGSRVSGNMLKDDQDALRASARMAKPAKGSKAKAEKPAKGRVSGNMLKDDQDAARAAAEAGSR